MRLSRSARAAVVLVLVSCGAIACACADTFSQGEFVTYSQVEWGEDPFPSNLTGTVLEPYFDSIFASTNDLMQIGIAGNAGHSIIFDSADALITYLPASGAPGPLTADLLDPVHSASGVLGGEVATLTLNVDFNDAGLVKGTSDVLFGDLILADLTGDQAFLNGLTVRQVLNDSNAFLGGADQPAFSYLDFFRTVNAIDMAFSEGFVSTFADEHLELPGSSANPVPEMSTLPAAGLAMLLLWAVKVLGRISLRPEGGPAPTSSQAP